MAKKLLFLMKPKEGQSTGDFAEEVFVRVQLELDRIEKEKEVKGNGDSL